jgi:hypothetical protein
MVLKSFLTLFSGKSVISLPSAFAPLEILSLLIAERDKLNKAIEVLQGTPKTNSQPQKAMPAVNASPTTNHTGKRRWTSAMKRAAAERAKAVWVRRRKEAAK